MPTNNPNGLSHPGPGVPRPAGGRALPAGGLGRDVYTTGQVARLAGVAPGTASKWCDRGWLPSYRLPGGNDRRVRRADLLAFARARGLAPLLLALGDPPGLLALAGCPAGLGARLAPHLPGWAVEEVPHLLAAGLAVADPGAAALVLGPALPRADAREACAWVAGLRGPRALVLLGDDDPGDGYPGAALLRPGADADLAAAVLRARRGY